MDRRVKEKQINSAWEWSDLAPVVFLATVTATIGVRLFIPTQTANSGITVPADSPLLLLGVLPQLITTVVLFPKYRSVIAPIPTKGRIFFLLLACMQILIFRWITHNFSDDNRLADSAVSALGSPWVLLYYALWILVLAPIAEELVFREWLPRKIPVFASLLPNATLFALMHYSTAWEFSMFTLLYFLNTWLIGGVLFIARTLTGNIHFAIQLHFVFNLLLIVDM